MTRIIPLLIAALALATACKRTPKVPEAATPVPEEAAIYPDYRDITLPPNIAPLNIQVKSAGTAYVGVISHGDQQVIAGAGSDGKLRFDPTRWSALLQAARGQDLTVELYARRDGAWVSFPAYKLHVAQEPVDRYLAYRLIEPSYEIYRQLGLYQRDLETFDEQPIYENNRTYEPDENHCVNCHNFQGYSTRRMLFHVRANHGGTVIVDGDKVEKYRMTTDSTLGNAVYPAWHPQHKFIAFSSNLTGQAFHLRNANKIEVVDYGSDLLFFDAKAGTITNILKTEDAFETFPCWSPDGRRLFFCSAYVPQFKGVDTGVVSDSVLRTYGNVRYDIRSLSFDERTRKFSEPRTEVACSAQGKSAAVPRISPDGRYLLYTLGNYGQFHIWHRDADLWVKNLETGEEYPLTAANSSQAESYHGWSSNGRWIAFASRRIDGNYSRAFLAYFDKDGRAHKAFLLPQEDPEHSILFMKSYNVPELSRDRVSIDPARFREVIHADERVKNAKYVTAP